VVGLGNPGTRYERTRHNAGFRVVELLAKRHAATAWRSKFSGKFAQVRDLRAALLMPQTFMNESGESVADCAGSLRVPIDRILVVCDDINLPFGRLRFRRSGSDGGHNGLKDIIAALQGQGFPRLRVGIGRNGEDAIDHVIGNFSKTEEAALPEIIERATAGVETFLLEGVDRAIATVNAFGGGLPDGDENGNSDPAISPA
jgi:peptidyl-tRNA hydrolase, PTH1 family